MQQNIRDMLLNSKDQLLRAAYYETARNGAKIENYLARSVLENGGYMLEDTGSRHGTFVNGRRVKRKMLENTDRVEFGAQDSYQLHFALDGAELKRWLDAGGDREAEQVGLDPGQFLADTIREEPAARVRADRLVAAALDL